MTGTSIITPPPPDLLDDEWVSWLSEPPTEFLLNVHKKKSPAETLRDHFGYSHFRLEQEAIIRSVLEKRDTLVLMPTGGGKSLCYQIPALIFEGLTLVISPLIALMKDQVDALRFNGIPAAYLNSTQSSNEQEEIIGDIRSRKLKLLYLAPEKLIRLINPENGHRSRDIADWSVSLIAVDEAHCISHWGHDFRPEYLMLAQLKQAFPNIPMIALTATADQMTRKDINEKLELRDPAIFIASFNRPNIRYSVTAKRGKLQKLLNFLRPRKSDSGIIYCLSRAATEKLAADLADEGFQALPYHAGMEREQRTINQDLFVRDEVKIIVATIAFGMGIDKSNVRYVVHMDLPKNIESYYQETGRAGRDGLESEALLFYSALDVSKLRSFAVINDNPEQTAICLKKLDQMARFGELNSCRRKYLLNYFDEEAPAYCGNCDVCLTRFEQIDATIPAQKVLSAIVRLREQYGAGYVVDFLRGSQSEKIRPEHKQLKTFGVGADLRKDQWVEIVRELIAQGLLVKSQGIYPVLRLTGKGFDVLKGELKVMLSEAKEKLNGISIQTTYETRLLVRLKELRKEISIEENVPAHVILSDSTLVELATRLPLHKDDFGRISGFGRVKIEKYGRRFWQIVVDYCKENRLTSRMHQQFLSPAHRDTDTKRESFDLFQQGHSIEEISMLRGLRPGTIETHLAHYVEQGRLPLEKVVPPAKIKVIREAFEKIGGNRLTPIKEYLGEDYSYGEIRMVTPQPPKGGEFQPPLGGWGERESDYGSTHVP